MTQSPARFLRPFSIRFIATIQRHPKRIAAALAALALTTAGSALAIARFAPDPSKSPVSIVVEIERGASSESHDAFDARFSELRLSRSDATRSIDTAGALLTRLGIDDHQADAFLRADPEAIAALGSPRRYVATEADSRNGLLSLRALWTEKNNPTRFKRLVVEKGPDGFSSRTESDILEPSGVLASGSIQNSLFAATASAQVPYSAAAQLQEIFAGDIDFHQKTKPGDRFSMVYESLRADGEPLGAGRVLSAEVVYNGKTYQAMWFPNAPGAEGSPGGYYTFDGKSRQSAYLASPVPFSLTTSSFAKRFHPIFHTWKAHQGVDYAAPAGTPVRAVAQGVVEFAGVQNGYGNVVILRHRANHSTVYAHLSRINARLGARVAQGQNIGSIGSSGLATGPHLHFEHRVDNVYKDPEALARFNEPLALPSGSKPVFALLAEQTRVALGFGEPTARLGD